MLDDLFFKNYLFFGCQVQKNLHKKTMIPLSLMILFETFPVPWLFPLPSLLGQNLGPSANLLYTLAHTNQFWPVANLMSIVELNHERDPTHFDPKTQMDKSSQGIHPSIHPCCVVLDGSIGVLEWVTTTTTYKSKKKVVVVVTQSVHPRKHTLFVCLFVFVSHFIFVKKGACASRKHNFIFFKIFFPYHILSLSRKGSCASRKHTLFVCLFVCFHVTFNHCLEKPYVLAKGGKKKCANKVARLRKTFCILIFFGWWTDEWCPLNFGCPPQLIN